MTIDTACIDACFDLAMESWNTGGLPIGSVLARGGTIIGRGHNRRVQHGNPILHGEMDAFRDAGRQVSYRDTVLYTSLSPCMMCSGTIVQFKIPRVVICDTINFGGNEQFLRKRGVIVEVLNEQRFVDMMGRFIEENPALWNEDIAE